MVTLPASGAQRKAPWCRRTDTQRRRAGGARRCQDVYRGPCCCGGRPRLAVAPASGQRPRPCVGARQVAERLSETQAREAGERRGGSPARGRAQGFPQDAKQARPTPCLAPALHLQRCPALSGETGSSRGRAAAHADRRRARRR